MEIIIKEKLNTEDFLEANFPHVLQPFYKRRYFLINMAFAVVSALATVYLYYISKKNHLKFQSVHYSYLFFALLFTLLAFYLIKRERRIYNNVVKQINDLGTTYSLSENNIKVDNEKVHLNYKTSEIKNISDLPKWFVFEFNNGERISLYKPNMTPEQKEMLKKMFKIQPA